MVLLLVIAPAVLIAVVAGVWFLASGLAVAVWLWPGLAPIGLAAFLITRLSVSGGRDGGGDHPGSAQARQPEGLRNPSREVSEKGRVVIVRIVAKYWLFLVIVAALLGVGTAAAVNALAMNGAGVGTGLLVSGVPNLKNGYEDGVKQGSAFNEAHPSGGDTSGLIGGDSHKGKSSSGSGESSQAKKPAKGAGATG
nr:hypothetical protein [Angustibacter aerolatus]